MYLLISQDFFLHPLELKDALYEAQELVGNLSYCGKQLSNKTTIGRQRKVGIKNKSTGRKNASMVVQA